MPSSIRQYVLIFVWLILVAFTIWSHNYLSFLFYTPILYLFYNPVSHGKVKELWVKQSDKTKNIVEWLISIFLGVLLITTINIYALSLYKMRSTSMLTGFKTGEIVLVDKLRAGPAIKIDNPDKFRRLKGFGSIKPFDVIVFHFPEGDTVFKSRIGDDYYYIKRQNKNEEFFKKESSKNLIYRPVKKRTKYIKRVIGTPGDTVLFKGGEGIVNGDTLPELPSVIHKYTIKDDVPSGETQVILNCARDQFTKDNKIYVELSNGDIKKNHFENHLERKILPMNLPDQNVFPFSSNYFWNKDNYGPIVIPQKGKKVELTVSNLPLYYRIIVIYENNKLGVKDNVIYINGKPAKSYTFRMNYYWVMGDNRPHSFDSRYWGFVPDSHIIGIVDKKIYKKD